MVSVSNLLHNIGLVIFLTLCHADLRSQDTGIASDVVCTLFCFGGPEGTAVVIFDDKDILKYVYLNGIYQGMLSDSSAGLGVFKEMQIGTYWPVLITLQLNPVRINYIPINSGGGFRIEKKGAFIRGAEVKAGTKSQGEEFIFVRKLKFSELSIPDTLLGASKFFSIDELSKKLPMHIKENETIP